MTTTANAPQDLVQLQIDGQDIAVPQGTLIIRAAEKAGIHIPRFCDHPLLNPVAACRQCLVEVAMPDREGNVRKMPKPQPACAMTVSPKMEVYTAATSEVSEKAQRGVMEFLLINHPMDCPVCDKGGECPLQNQTMTDGRARTRFVDIKRTYPKPISVSPQILLDRDRCILCQRCTRFTTQIPGDPFLQLQGRGGGEAGRHIHGLHGSQIGNFDATVLGFSDHAGTDPEITTSNYSGPDGAAGMQIGFAAGSVTPGEMDRAGRPFSSYFSGNVIQICPVGALTSASYRFRARPFDLVSVPSVSEHDASGSAIRVDYRRGKVVRRLALEDMDVNEDWITDKDRFAFRWQDGADRLRAPRVNGEESVSWFAALEAAAAGLNAAKDRGVAVLTGGRLTLEDAYAYSKFARTVLGTNDIDFRTRPTSDEEDAFLAAVVAGTGLGVTYADIEKAGHVLTVGLEAEDEIGSVFLRLRKGALAGTTSVSVISAYPTLGTKKMMARFIPASPGTEAEVLDAITAENGELFAAAAADLQQENSVILVGERAADAPGALSAALRLAAKTGAKLAWIPRRAGDRASVEAGLMPNLLPGGRPVTDAAARREMATAWGVDELPATPGRNTAAILQAAAAGEIGAVILAGVELADLPRGAAAALENVFVVQLEVRETETTALADVVLPVAPTAEKGGTFVNWEGRLRPFGQTLTSTNLPDRAVLTDLADVMGIGLGLAKLDDAVTEYAQLPAWNGARVAAPQAAPAPAPTVGAGQAVLATWKQLLDDGALQSHEPYLASSARRSVAVLAPQTAEQLGITTALTVSGPAGSVALPVHLVDMPTGVVWIPQNAADCKVATIGSRAGDVVAIAKSEVAE
ncbi:MAG: NADH-quinone oxidoreductase subunit G [Trueperella sp.]|nr:NADH-quinone oxidoreductase subunit G [Trueperella sp.]